MDERLREYLDREAYLATLAPKELVEACALLGAIQVGLLPPRPATDPSPRNTAYTAPCLGRKGPHPMLAIIKAIGRGIRIFWTEPPRKNVCHCYGCIQIRRRSIRISDEGSLAYITYRHKRNA